MATEGPFSMEETAGLGADGRGLIPFRAVSSPDNMSEHPSSQWGQDPLHLVEGDHRSSPSRVHGHPVAYQVGHSMAYQVGHSKIPAIMNPARVNRSIMSDCSPPCSSVHGILQARTLEWVAISFSRRSSLPRDQTWVSGIAGRFFTN